MISTEHLEAIDRLGGDRSEHLAAAVQQYLERQRVLREWAEAAHLDQEDGIGVIPEQG